MFRELHNKSFGLSPGLSACLFVFIVAHVAANSLKLIGRIRHFIQIWTHVLEVVSPTGIALLTAGQCTIH